MSGLNSETFAWSRFFEIISLISLVFATFLDPTTETLYRIHSDTPALFFCFYQLDFFKFSMISKNKFISFCAMCLCLAFWSNYLPYHRILSLFILLFQTMEIL